MNEQEELNLTGIRPDTLEPVLDSGIESNPESEEKATIEFTFDEKKKLLRAMGRKNLTDQEIEDLTENEIEEIKEFAKLKERKAIYRFVTRKKTVTDDEVKNLTDEEIEDMIAKSYVMARHFSYNPKKDFGVAFKKERQRKNKQAKASRKANR